MFALRVGKLRLLGTTRQKHGEAAQAGNPEDGA
jgi:hypothetical protein